MVLAAVMRPQVLVLSQANGYADAASPTDLQVPTLEERLLTAREPNHHHHQPRRGTLTPMLRLEQFQRNSRERYRLRLLH